MVSGYEGLVRLQEGNRRFVASIADTGPALTQTRRLALAEGQQPFAIILGCSDSRVPAELVFGQGFGDLFVIRVAGNIVAPSQVGSVEFAAERFETRRRAQISRHPAIICDMARHCSSGGSSATGW